MSLARDMDHIAELATREAVALSLRDGNGETPLDRMEAMKAGHPRAASWEEGPRSDKLYCPNHETDLKVCHSKCWPCIGESHYVGHSDPTADAALDPDVAATDIKNLREAVDRMKNDAELIANIVEAYPPRRSASAHERQLAADENEPRCESCCRVEISKGIPWWVAPQINGSGQPYRTTRDGKLKEPMYLCDWCDEHTGRKGCLPNTDELEQRRDGKRVHCKHPDAKEEAA